VKKLLLLAEFSCGSYQKRLRPPALRALALRARVGLRKNEENEAVTGDRTGKKV